MQYAIYVGVLLSIGIYLVESSRLHITVLDFDETGRATEYPLDRRLPRPADAVVLNIQGSLYFAAAEQLEQAVALMLDSGAKVIILRLREARELASTGVIALRASVRRARSRGAEILICGADPVLTQRLRASGLLAELGPEPFFPAESIASARRALQHAVTLSADMTLARSTTLRDLASDTA